MDFDYSKLTLAGLSSPTYKPIQPGALANYGKPGGVAQHRFFDFGPTQSQTSAAPTSAPARSDYNFHRMDRNWLSHLLRRGEVQPAQVLRQYGLTSYSPEEDARLVRQLMGFNQSFVPIDGAGGGVSMSAGP